MGSLDAASVVEAASVVTPKHGLAPIRVTSTERLTPTLSFDINDGALQSLIEALPAAVYTTDAAGRITFFNQAAVDMWGCRPELGKSEWCGSWKLYWPDGRPLPHDQCPMAMALQGKAAHQRHGSRGGAARRHPCSFHSLSDADVRRLRRT